MNIKTRLFGEIEVDEQKVITFENGVIGFESLKKYILIHNEEKRGLVSWLQSIEEPTLALPVIDPLCVENEYNPTVEDELLLTLGNIQPENLLVLTVVTIPNQIENISTNLKAPIVINADNLKACQIIVEDKDYLVKYPIYEILKKKKEEE